MKKFEQYINGEFSSGSKYFESVNPANGRVWANFPAANEEETKLAVESAHKALFEGEWASYTATQRGKLLHKLNFTKATDFYLHAVEIGDIETKDSGKLAVETRMQYSLCCRLLLLLRWAC